MKIVNLDIKKSAFCLFFVLSQVSCTHIATSNSAKFALRPVEEKTLPNGFRIIYLPDNALPKVGLQLMLNSGSAQDDKDEVGLSSFMMSTIDQGTTHKSALEVADGFAEIGSALGKSASADYLMVNTAGLSKTRSELLKLFSDVVLSPSFANVEIERKRQQILAEIQQLPDRPTEFASTLMDKELFLDHPYGDLVIGTLKTIKEISRTQIIKSYYLHFRPQNAVLAVTGNFDQAFKDEIEKIFLSWGARGAETKKNTWPTDSAAPAKILYSKSGLKQAQIRFAHLSIPRNHADFLAVRLANLILGGSFASRLNQKVRDDLGLTYSINSSLDAKVEGGSLEVNTFSRQEKVGEVIKNTEAVFAEFAKTGVTKKELSAAKALLVGQFPAAIETVERLAFNMMLLRRNGMTDDYLRNFFSLVDGVKLSEVNEVIKKHFRPNNLRVLVYADAKEVQSQLEALGTVQIKAIE